jgi:transposase
METQKNRVCGADIHKRFLVATIISRDGTKITKRFGMILDDLLEFKNWIIENQCEQVAVESTGTYWLPIMCLKAAASSYLQCWLISSANQVDIF